MRKKIITFFVISGLVVLSGWSPWITEDVASNLSETQFNRAWNTVVDGCGTSGDGLGTRFFSKVPFGAIVTLDYQCGLVMPNEPVLHKKIYVSFTGIAFGYPKP